MIFTLPVSEHWACSLLVIQWLLFLWWNSPPGSKELHRLPISCLCYMRLRYFLHELRLLLNRIVFFSHCGIVLLICGSLSNLFNSCFMFSITCSCWLIVPIVDDNSLSAPVVFWWYPAEKLKHPAIHEHCLFGLVHAAHFDTRFKPFFGSTLMNICVLVCYETDCFKRFASLQDSFWGRTVNFVTQFNRGTWLSAVSTHMMQLCVESSNCCVQFDDLL